VLLLILGIGPRAPREEAVILRGARSRSGFRRCRAGGVIGCGGRRLLEAAQGGPPVPGIDELPVVTERGDDVSPRTVIGENQASGGSVRGNTRRERTSIEEDPTSGWLVRKGRSSGP
jgi:hypothetical protein